MSKFSSTSEQNIIENDKRKCIERWGVLVDSINSSDLIPNKQILKYIKLKRVILEKKDGQEVIEDYRDFRDEYIKLKDDWFREIKCIKMEDEKFRLNVIKENQKFIDFQQVQSANYNNNVKQMFDCVNEDVDVLKNAPIEMIKAGYGDIVGKYSAL